VILFIYIVDVTMRDEASVQQCKAAGGGFWPLRFVRSLVAGADGFQKMKWDLFSC